MSSTAVGVAISCEGAETGSCLGVERHRMRRIREVLRLKYECGLSHRSISASTGMSKGSVNDYLRRADDAGMTWERAREHDDAAGESPLFTAVGRSEAPERAPIDFEWVRREMCSPMGANGGRTRTATSARSIAASRRRSTSSCGRITAPARSSLSITRASAETGEAEKVVSVRPAAS